MKRNFLSVFAICIAVLGLVMTNAESLNTASKWFKLMIQDMDLHNKYELPSTTDLEYTMSFALASYYSSNFNAIPSVFRVPQNSCPPDFSIGIINMFNKQRFRQGLNPLYFSETAEINAQKWVSTNRVASLWEDNKETRFGQLAWGFWTRGFSPRKFVNYSAPFIDNGDYRNWGDEAVLLYFGPGYSRPYTDWEWKNTNEIGVGCATYHTTSGTSFYVATYFPHPTNGPPKSLKMTRKFSVPSAKCPAGFLHDLLVQFTNVRKTFTDSHLMYDIELSTDAMHLAIDASTTTTTKELTSINHGVLSWSQSWNVLKKTDFKISVNDLFTEKWNNGVPKINSEDDNRFFTKKEWIQTSRIGVGCVTSVNREQPNVRLDIVVLFNMPF